LYLKYASEIETWKKLKKEMKVVSYPVVGPLASSKIPIQLAVDWIDCNSSAILYNFLVSPSGFDVIDPVLTYLSNKKKKNLSTKKILFIYLL
jgi:hypothetical protein